MEWKWSPGWAATRGKEGFGSIEVIERMQHVNVLWLRRGWVSRQVKAGAYKAAARRRASSSSRSRGEDGGELPARSLPSSCNNQPTQSAITNQDNTSYHNNQPGRHKQARGGPGSKDGMLLLLLKSSITNQHMWAIQSSNLHFNKFLGNISWLPNWRDVQLCCVSD